MEAALE